MKCNANADLALDPTDYIQEDREHHAKQDRSDDGKIKRRVSAAINNVTRQAPDGEARPAGQHQSRAKHHENQP